MSVRSFKFRYRGLFCRLRTDRSGNILMITALLLPVLVGGVGLATDAGLWFYTHQKMQSAADSAVLSAALSSTASKEADAVAASYGFVAGSNGVTVTVNSPPHSGAYASTSGATEVVITQPQTPLFSAIFVKSAVEIAARAVALTSGKGCVLALDRSATSAVGVQGTSAVTLNNCSLYDNSNASTALSVGGSGQITALSVGVVGGESGASSITTTQGNHTGMGLVADPYANASFGTFSGCDKTNFSAKTTVTIDHGVYCGGMKLNAGAIVTMNPGIYYIDQGCLCIAGGATLTGDGVTIVFTSSTGSNWATATINGGATVTLTAPTTGPTAGIVFFGDRRMPAGTAFKLNGGSTQVFGGAIYLPEAAVTFAGGSGTSAVGCTQLVADTITFNGNSNFALNCTGTGIKPLGAASILVE
jgi:Flp pilus assembly protein TadG